MEKRVKGACYASFGEYAVAGVAREACHALLGVEPGERALQNAIDGESDAVGPYVDDRYVHESPLSSAIATSSVSVVQLDEW